MGANASGGFIKPFFSSASVGKTLARVSALAVLLVFATTAVVVAAQPERKMPEPWEVSYPSWSGNFFLEPGGKVVVKINVTFLEPGVYTAFFELYAYEEQGVILGIPVVPSLLGSVELPADYYSGTVTLTIEATVPEDVACGAPLIVEGYVVGRSERSYAVVNGEERPFAAHYLFDLAPACALTVQDALETYRKLGGKEGVAAFNAQLDSLRKEVERLQSEKARLERALGSTQAELEKTASEKAALREELNAAKAENARLNATVTQLNQQLLGLTAEKQLLMTTVTTLTILLTGTAAVLLAVLLLYAVPYKKERKK